MTVRMKRGSKLQDEPDSLSGFTLPSTSRGLQAFTRFGLAWSLLFCRNPEKMWGYDTRRSLETVNGIYSF